MARQRRRQFPKLANLTFADEFEASTAVLGDTLTLTIGYGEGDAAVSVETTYTITEDDVVVAERDVTGEVAIDPTRVIENITQQLLAENPRLSGFDVHGRLSNNGDLSIEVTGTPGISFETGLTVQYTDPVTGELETVDADVVELTAAVEGVDAASVTVDLVNQTASGSATGK